MLYKNISYNLFANSFFHRFLIVMYYVISLGPYSRGALWDIAGDCRSLIGGQTIPRLTDCNLLISFCCNLYDNVNKGLSFIRLQEDNVFNIRIKSNNQLGFASQIIRLILMSHTLSSYNLIPRPLLTRYLNAPYTFIKLEYYDLTKT